MTVQTRRDFLRHIGLAGMGMTIPVVGTVSPAMGASPAHHVSRTLPLMSTLVTITVCDRSRQRAIEAQEAAFATAEKLIPVFDRFRSDSHISRLNQAGILRDVPPELDTVLSSCSSLFRQSSGRFDITVLPVLQATRHAARRTGVAPSPQELHELRSLVGFEHLRRTPSGIRLTRRGMAVTLDGIAKGYIVDQAAATLRSYGIDSALINAGGDIRVIGGKGNGPWKVGMQDPRGRTNQLMTLGLFDAAVATSGSYENFFDPLARHYHLVQKDGHSPRRPVSTTVVAPSAMLADGLATTLFLLSPRQGLQLASSMPGVQAAVVTHGNRVMTTPGLNSLRV